MADISKINLSGAVYNIKDATARANLNEIQNISNAEIDEITDLVLESLPSSYVYGYETAAAMQADLDLQEGMIAHTNGFTTSGDGDAAYYTISNSGTADGSTILALQNGLRAIKVSERNLVDAIPNMSATTRGIAKVGAGLAMNGDALELDGNGDIATAVTSYLNAHPEATTTVEDGAITTNKLADGAVTDDKLVQTGGVLDEVKNLENITHAYRESLTPSATSSGWALTGTGPCIADSSSKIVKYAVTAGDRLYLRLSADNAGVYQWQNNASVPSNNNQYVVGEPVTTAISGLTIVPDGATYLIVSQLNTNTTNLVQSARSQFITPTLRNGSMGNPANANAITMSYVQPIRDASSVRIKADINLSDGQKFWWVVETFDSYGQASQETAITYTEPYYYGSNNYIEIVNDGTFVGFSAAVWVKNLDNSFTPLRVENLGNCFTCEYLYVSDNLLNIENTVIRPHLNDGTILNVANANCVNTPMSLSTHGASFILLTYEGELSDGQTIS